MYVITLARYCGYVKVYRSILYVNKTVALIHVVLYSTNQAPKERHQVPKRNDRLCESGRFAYVTSLSEVNVLVIDKMY